MSKIYQYRLHVPSLKWRHSRAIIIFAEKFTPTDHLFSTLYDNSMVTQSYDTNYELRLTLIHFEVASDIRIIGLMQILEENDRALSGQQP